MTYGSKATRWAEIRLAYAMRRGTPASVARSARVLDAARFNAYAAKVRGSVSL